MISILALLSLKHVQAQDQESALADSLFILQSFRVADDFMSHSLYDSAQFYLNKIHERVTYLQPSLVSYFLSARQAEVYYYNNLQQLGMQEAKRAMKIAETLKDRYLQTDAYNFTGLFYVNTGQLKEAILSFKKGIDLSRQPPFPAQYLELSNPHHLYGNLAEAYEKNNQQDSAIFYGKISLLKAEEINQKRGIISALLGLGSAFLKDKQVDSAVDYFKRTLIKATEYEEVDLKAVAYGGLAACAALKNNQEEVFENLNKGFAIFDDYPQLNSFYQILFLEQAEKLYQHYKQYEQLAKTLLRKSEIQTAMSTKNNNQYRNLLMTGLKNETRILNLEIEKAHHERVLATTRLYVVILIILIMIAGFITYRYYTLQRLKMANLRNKISQDLHDEVGATLSGIALYSYIARQQYENEEASALTQSLDIIDKNATDMVKKLSDIVWAVNPVHDSLDALLHRLGDYAIEMASVKGIDVSIQKEEELNKLKLTMEQRKNIYLIIKEAVNNAIKYSACSQLKITAALIAKEIVFTVTDDGTGFDVESIQKGNGLVNMQSRAKELNGNIAIESTVGSGTTIRFSCHIS